MLEKCSYRLAMPSWVMPASRSRLNVSIVNEAMTVPWAMALRMPSMLVSPVLAMWAIMPPAKVSPAPVGSTTFSVG